MTIKDDLKTIYEAYHYGEAFLKMVMERHSTILPSYVIKDETTNILHIMPKVTQENSATMKIEVDRGTPDIETQLMGAQGRRINWK